MDELLSAVEAMFPDVVWTGTPGSYRGALPGGYIQATERTKMDAGTRGDVAFYVANPKARQVFAFGWRARDQREGQLVRARLEMAAIHRAAGAALGVQNG